MKINYTQKTKFPQMSLRRRNFNGELNSVGITLSSSQEFNDHDKPDRLYIITHPGIWITWFSVNLHHSLFKSLMYSTKFVWHLGRLGEVREPHIDILNFGDEDETFTRQLVEGRKHTVASTLWTFPVLFLSLLPVVTFSICFSNASLIR